MNLQQNKIHIVYGTTASGKTDLSLKLAQQAISPAIINADSMQIYREIPIITNQPTEVERAGIEHLLFGYKSITEHSDLNKWLTEVADEIKTQQKKGKTVILVGGTGMYLKCLVEGVTAIPDIPRNIRADIMAEIETEGLSAVYEKLLLLDKRSGKLKQGDTQRIIRAYEVVKHTEKSIFDWQKESNKKFFEVEDFTIHYLNIDRAKTYEKINQRFLKMIDQGVVEEAKAASKIFDKAVQNGAKLSDLSAHKAHGLRELIAYTKGEMTLELAIEKGQQVTRNYAKRQLTWWRGWSSELQNKLNIVQH